jgi:hypothetical protein
VNSVDADHPVTIVARRLELHQQTDTAWELGHLVKSDGVEATVLEGAGIDLD